MKTLSTFLLMSCIFLCSFAKPESQAPSFVNDAVKIECVMPTFDMPIIGVEYALWDVYAPAVAYIGATQSTLDGFQVVEERPPAEPQGM